MPFMTQVGDIPTQSTKSAVMARFRGVDLTGDVTTTVSYTHLCPPGRSGSCSSATVWTMSS